MMNTVIPSMGFDFYSFLFNSGSSSNDFCEFMMPFFSPAAFSGFGEDPKGFYCVYRNAFDSILKKEQYRFLFVFISRSVDKSIYYPSFGSSSDSFDSVLQFYSSWGSFITRRSFAAADQYNTTQVYVISHIMIIGC